MKNKFIFGLLLIPALLFVACDNDSDDETPVEEPDPIVGTWKLQPVAGALAVGPSAGSADWWFNTADDVNTRACLFDDTYTFNEDGTFEIAMGAQTWLETWQGVNEEGCGSPVAPHAGGSFTYAFDETAGTLTLTGNGAHVGLAKVNNQGELPNVEVPSAITYSVAEFTGEGTSRKMKLIVEAGSGVFWTFLLEIQ
ncbi:hypothetical protein [Roseivirga sp.]|uniref:hypothetical protein n=1 Tax=Roseivirga sp. TaxID=1964215 RepID=UPI003B528503